MTDQGVGFGLGRVGCIKTRIPLLSLLYAHNQTRHFWCMRRFGAPFFHKMAVLLSEQFVRNIVDGRRACYFSWFRDV